MPAYSSIHPPPEMFRRRRIIGEPPTFRSGSIEDGQSVADIIEVEAPGGVQLVTCLGGVTLHQPATRRR